MSVNGSPAWTPSDGPRFQDSIAPMVMPIPVQSETGVTIPPPDQECWMMVEDAFLEACGVTNVSALLTHRTFLATIQEYKNQTKKRVNDLLRRTSTKKNAMTTMHPDFYTAVLTAFSTAEAKRKEPPPPPPAPHPPKEAPKRRAPTTIEELQGRFDRFTELTSKLQKLPMGQDKITVKIQEAQKRLEEDAASVAELLLDDI